MEWGKERSRHSRGKKHAERIIGISMCGVKQRMVSGRVEKELRRGGKETKMCYWWSWAKKTQSSVSLFPTYKILRFMCVIVSAGSLSIRFHSVNLVFNIGLENQIQVIILAIKVKHYSLKTWIFSCAILFALPTMIGHFVSYSLITAGWTCFFCHQYCLNSMWHRFHMILGTFIIDFGPY